MASIFIMAIPTTYNLQGQRSFTLYLYVPSNFFFHHKVNYGHSEKSEKKLLWIKCHKNADLMFLNCAGSINHGWLKFSNNVTQWFLVYIFKKNEKSMLWSKHPCLFIEEKNFTEERCININTV